MRRSFFCIDAHTCGNPVRLVAGGGPILPHLPIAERRDIFVAKHDWVRQALMFEPRGHDIMSGVILYLAYREDCDIAVLFIEVSGCLPMCGAGTIGLVTAAIEEGLLVPRVEGCVSLETPAGKVDVTYEKTGDAVTSVRMYNVPSYLHASDIEVDVPNHGRLTVDIAYGGNFYAVIEPQSSWSGLDGMNAGEIVDLSVRLQDALAEICDPVHPENSSIRGVHHAIWCDQSTSPNADGRGAVFYGDKAIDRSPGGTGTSARMAQLHGKGRLPIGKIFRQESLIGTVFEGRLEEQVEVGPFRGVRPSVSGWARIIGHNTIFVDDRDPLKHGFQIR